MKNLSILEGIVSRIEKSKSKSAIDSKLKQYERAEGVYIERFGYQPKGSEKCYRTVEQIKNSDLSDSEKKEAYWILENKQEIIPILLTPLRERISIAKTWVQKKKDKAEKKSWVYHHE